MIKLIIDRKISKKNRANNLKKLNNLNKNQLKTLINLVRLQQFACFYCLSLSFLFLVIVRKKVNTHRILLFKCKKIEGINMHKNI